MSVISEVALTISAKGQRAMSKSMSEHLATWARVTPENEALTFIDYSVERSGVPQTLTYAELDRQATAAAARLQAFAKQGDRVALLMPQTMQYIVYFLGALRAGITAVPLFSPDLPGHGDRLQAVLADCDPSVVLADQVNLEVVRNFVAGEPGSAHRTILNADEPERTDYAFAPVEVELSDIAYIQYTSGSTRIPAGVLISQGNVVADSIQAILAYANRPEGRANLVSWLPLFHDMGLVFVVGGSVVGGLQATFMDPIAFLLRPFRWMEQMGARPYTITMAPNFAFDYAAAKLTDADRAKLDLSDVHAMVNGAEPVRADTLTRFNEAFGPLGLKPSVVRPSYGLAEATVYVCGGFVDAPATVEVFDFDQLSRGSATTEVSQASNRVKLVACGVPNDQLVAIADPQTGEHLPDGAVGEIWVHGPNVASGYWNKPELSEEVFSQTLVGARDMPGRSWMRTGDLGTIHGGELYVTGRMKDLIIVDGRNHYPQDLEATAEEAHSALGRHRCAAFSITDDIGERLVLVAEISRHAKPGDWDVESVSRAVRGAISKRHNVAVHDILLVAQNEVPRTSSGKIARSATRMQYLNESLTLAGV